MFLPFPPTISSLTFSIAIVLCTYITHLCFSSPNPQPQPSGNRDRIGILANPAAMLGRTVILVLGLSHAFLSLTFPKLPAFMCPNASENLSLHLFSWNLFTATCISLVFVAGPVRLLAYSQLGKNFTFRLAKPKSLIKHGLYAYMQHPSYTTLMIVVLAQRAMLARSDGVIGCWLPPSVIEMQIWRGLEVILVLGGFWGLFLRIRDEEVMLRREFGKEWDEYNAKTKRFIPCIF